MVHSARRLMLGTAIVAVLVGCYGPVHFTMLVVVPRLDAEYFVEFASEEYEALAHLGILRTTMERAQATQQEVRVEVEEETLEAIVIDITAKMDEKYGPESWRRTGGYRVSFEHGYYQIGGIGT